LPYKVFIVSSSKQYEDMFLERGFELTKEMQESDLVQFTGGADVSPSYYGQKRNPRTGVNATRDKEDSRMYNNATYFKIPMVGICRGGQFLNVMNGGKMWQHVDGHAINGTHPIVDAETKKLICEVSSTHHQMMRPFGGEVLAVAKESTFLEDDKDRYGCELIDHDDVEVVWFPRAKTLCFQPHPEFNGVKECRDYYFELLNKHLLVKPPKSETGKTIKTEITAAGTKISFTSATTTKKNYW